MECTLKVNMILADGQHYPRGSIVAKEMIPLHLRGATYIENGVITINRLMPIDLIEIKDTNEGDEEEEAASPMRELTLGELEMQYEESEEPEEKPQRSKVVRRRLKRKTA